MRSSAAIILMLAGLCLAPRAQAVMLAWDVSAGADRYLLYYGHGSGLYTTMLPVGPSTQASVNGSLVPGMTYYFAATAVNPWGESGFSNEVRYVVPNPKPTVAIVTPVPGATVERKSLVPVVAEVSALVVMVDLWVDGTLLCHRTSPPYQCDWDVPAANKREYLLQAQATDGTGQIGLSPLVEVMAQ